VYLLGLNGRPIGHTSAFYGMVPAPLLIPVIALATLATIIASQALITGSFTLITEAMRLGLWPKTRIVYPSNVRGQLYVPGINWLLMLGCVAVTLYFRESSRMEAAFGLAVTLTMLMSTLLVTNWMRQQGTPWWLVVVLSCIFLPVELSFLTANLVKFLDGGWISVLLGFVLLFVMWVYHKAGRLKDVLVETEPLAPHLLGLAALSNDAKIPRTATNLIYLTASNSPEQIERKVPYSIFSRGPKRADLYWFVHVNVLDEPYRASYKAEVLLAEEVVWVTFNLGFRVEPRVGMLLRQVVQEMVAKGEVTIESRYDTLRQMNVPGDFRFVLLQSVPSLENDLSPINRLALNAYYRIKQLGLSDRAGFGLDTSNVTIETVPLFLTPPKNFNLTREP
jgi:KUP system potassium uptake protein